MNPTDVKNQNIIVSEILDVLSRYEVGDFSKQISNPERELEVFGAIIEKLNSVSQHLDAQSQCQTRANLWERFISRKYSFFAIILGTIIILALGFLFTTFLQRLTGQYYHSSATVIIVCVAIYGGVYSGIGAAIVFSFLADYYLMLPIGSVLDGPESIQHLLVNIILGIVVGLIVSGFRRSFHRQVVFAKQEVARARIQESVLRNHLQRCLSAVKMGVWEWDVRTNSLQWDQSMYQLYGIDPAAFSGAYSAWENAVHPNDKARANQAAQDALTQGLSQFSQQYRVVLPNGSILHNEAICYIERAKDGTPLKVMGVDYDITERKKAENTLRESDERYYTIFNHAADGIVMVSGDGTLVEANDTFVRMHGYSQNEMVDMKLGALSTAANQTVPTRLKQMLAGETIAFEAEHFKKDGSKLPLSVVANSISLEGKTMIVAMCRDLTARKQAELALKASEARFRTIVENSLVGIWLLDPQFNLTYGNPRMGEMLGCSPCEFVGTNPTYWVHEDDKSELVLRLDSRRQGVSEVYPLRLRRKDSGDIIHVLLSGTPLLDGSRIVGSVGMLMDVTETKRVESELAESRAQLFQAAKLATLGEMSAGMAHEMNQPMAGISLAVQAIKMLKQKNLLTDVELEASLKDIRVSVERCTNVIKHVRAFARQEVLSLNSIDLNQTIESALMLMGEQLRLRGIEVVKYLSDEGTNVYGDQFRLEQVWINLLSNARDALDEMEDESKKLSSRNGMKYRKTLSISSKPDNEFIVVEISDNGIGMSEDVMSRVFNPFFTTKPPGKGTGLGLSIVHGILDSHKAEVEIKSTQNKGTTFSVRLPIYRGQLETTGQNQLRSESLFKPTSEKPVSVKLLVIDDEEQLRNVLTRLLSARGYEVFAAENGSIGLEVFAQASPDVVITDMQMPVMGGVEVLKAVKEKSPATVVILITGDIDPVASVAMQKLGAFECLQKPASLDEICDSIERGLAGIIVKK